MYKKVLIPTLLALSLFCLAYAIYRSLQQTITTVENGNQVVYNEPQHGFLLGLCLLAGACILGAIVLLMDKKTETPVEDRFINKTTTTTNTSNSRFDR